MIITRISPLTGKSNSRDLDIKPAAYRRWKMGEPIQFCFPHLSADEREFIKIGFLPGEYAAFVGVEDDVEEVEA